MPLHRHLRRRIRRLPSEKKITPVTLHIPKKSSKNNQLYFTQSVQSRLEKCSPHDRLLSVENSLASRTGEQPVLPHRRERLPGIAARLCAFMRELNPVFSDRNAGDATPACCLFNSCDSWNSWTSLLRFDSSLFRISYFVFFPPSRIPHSEHPVRKFPRNRTKMQKSPVLVRLVRKFVRKFLFPNTPFGKSDAKIAS